MVAHFVPDGRTFDLWACSAGHRVAVELPQQGTEGEVSEKVQAAHDGEHVDCELEVTLIQAGLPMMKMVGAMPEGEPEPGQVPVTMLDAAI